MEVGVRIVGIILRILNFLLAPIYWLRLRNSQKVPPIKDKLLLQSATDIIKSIKGGNISSEEVVSRFIARIQEVNPYINAVVDERYRAALDDARQVDRLISDARTKGEIEQLFAEKPLLGIPFTVKESCSLAGLSNAVGCLEHAGRKASSDGEAVRRARAAGAIPLLVSNTPELCLGWETTNLLRGRTNNPHCLGRTPGGSSGGEAALLACGATPFSVASDIAGSIRIPAAFCGVYGHKPTPGIISISGHIPTLSDENYARLLTVGPMARHAADLAPLMRALAAPAARASLADLDDPVDMSDLTDFRGFILIFGSRRFECFTTIMITGETEVFDVSKVYYMTEATRSAALLRVHGGVQRAVRRAACYLRDCGATLSEEKFTEFEDSVEMSVSVFFSMKDIPNMLQDPANPKHERSLAVELAKLCAGCGSRSLQALGFALLRRHRVGLARSALPRHAARAAALAAKLRARLARAVLIYPAHCSLAHAHGAVYARASGVAYSMLFNVLGLPATVVPAGMHDGLPLALQIISAPNQDRLCLAVAKELEKCFGGWHPA